MLLTLESFLQMSHQLSRTLAHYDSQDCLGTKNSHNIIYFISCTFQHILIILVTSRKAKKVAEILSNLKI